jgi:hypothetical protein
MGGTRLAVRLERSAINKTDFPGCAERRIGERSAAAIVPGARSGQFWLVSGAVRRLRRDMRTRWVLKLSKQADFHQEGNVICVRL